jgi:hypothetical protein
MRRYVATMPAVDALITQMQVGQRATEDILPPEIRNHLYKCVVFSDDMELVERSSKSIGLETIVVSETTRDFYLDVVSDTGESKLFNRAITKVKEIADELLSLVTPSIMFTFKSADGLRLFAKQFAAHTAVCTRRIELHVEFDYTSSMDEADRQTLANWGDLEGPHGRQEDAHGVFRKWVTALEGLPKESTYVHLVFPYFWRDFRSLRGMSNKYGLSQYHVTFQFPRDRDTHPLSDTEHRFFVA